jgi:hypothetical protein
MAWVMQSPRDKPPSGGDPLHDPAFRPPGLMVHKAGAAAGRSQRLSNLPF